MIGRLVLYKNQEWKIVAQDENKSNNLSYPKWDFIIQREGKEVRVLKSDIQLLPVEIAQSHT